MNVLDKYRYPNSIKYKTQYRHNTSSLYHSDLQRLCVDFIAGLYDCGAYSTDQSWLDAWIHDNLGVIRT